MQPKLIIHGGAGSSLQGKGGLAAVRQLLHQIASDVYQALDQGMSATEAVVLGCQLLEDEPRFNAGTGSVLQSDGQVRMSASLMDGASQCFSGVINVAKIKNPIQVAQVLQRERDRVLSDIGAAELVRELQMPIHNPLTDLRLNEWLEERKGNFDKTMATVVAEPTGAESVDAGRGTIGVVVLDQAGKIAAGTSTGGKGFERIGRVSDSAMPAGNYANAQAGVSCTGIGEDIINECLAAKVVIRTTDGLPLTAAIEKSMAEAKERGCDLGAIALDAQGNIAWGKTSEILLAAYHTGTAIGDTLEWAEDELMGSIWV
ncbi:MAG: isoaspartyl peptidase/L-asparaginase [Cyanobacteria bacterium P01_G01_bin.54]